MKHNTLHTGYIQSKIARTRTASSEARDYLKLLSYIYMMNYFIYVHIYTIKQALGPTGRKDSVDEALLCKKNFSFLHNNASSTLYVFPTSWVSACLIVYS